MEASKMRNATARTICVGILLVTVAFGSSGCDTFTSIKEWTVGFAHEVGDYVSEKAEVFADALRRAWIAFFQTSDVVVDPADPTKGTFSGKLKCEVAWGKDGANKLTTILDHPRMQRSSKENTSWELDRGVMETIDELHKKLMTAH
jgi:hypothetical protein